MENEPITNEQPISQTPLDTNYIPEPTEQVTDENDTVTYIPSANEEVYSNAETTGNEVIDSDTNEPQEETTQEIATEAEITNQIEKTETLFKELSDENLNLLDLYETEYAKNGSYSDATYEALKAKGWDKSHIDIVSDAIEIKVGEFANKLVEFGGGAEQYQAVQEWVKNGKAPQADLDRYNQAINNGDLAYAKLQLNAWQAEYNQNKGTKPAATLQNIQAGTARKQIQGFGSINEQVAAINDPRYSQGGAYQKEVQARMLASNINFQPY